MNRGHCESESPVSRDRGQKEKGQRTLETDVACIIASPQFQVKRVVENNQNSKLDCTHGPSYSAARTFCDQSPSCLQLASVTLTGPLELWAAEPLVCWKALSHPHTGKLADLSLLKSPAPALGSGLFHLHCLPSILTFPFTVALTSLISCLFEKISMTTSESKIKMLNYTYPNIAKNLN